MNRRRFIQCAATGLFVPSAFSITPQQRAAIFGPKPPKPVVSGGTPSCPSTPNQDVDPTDADTTAALYCGNGATSTYTGQVNWSDSTGHAICRLDFKMGVGSGNISSGYTYNAVICTQTGATINLPVVATSATVNGGAWGTGTWIEFDFASPYSTTGSALYSLLVRANNPNESNYAYVYCTAASQITGRREFLNASGEVQLGSGTVDAGIRIYWQ